MKPTAFTVRLLNDVNFHRIVVIILLVLISQGCEALVDLADSDTTYTLRSCYWAERVDNDQDGWSCRGKLMVEVDETGNFEKVLRVTGMMKRTGETEWTILGTYNRTIKGNADDPLVIEVTGPTMLRGTFDFSVTIVCSRDSVVKWTRIIGPSDDEDLRAQKFESLSDDNVPDP